MNKNKVVYVIPGFKQKPTNKAYQQITKILKKEGYYPVLIHVSWKETTISENTKFFLKEYKN